MMKSIAFAAILALGASACAPTPPAESAAPAAPAAPVTPEPPMPTENKDACGASALAHLVGKPITDTAVPPASPAVRHIRPGDAVTEDYRLERLNIYVTGADVIEKINCG